MLNKITKTSFKSVERNIKLLELIHSDLCDFQYNPSFGNKKYIISFIDDFSRFSYVFLLHSKDETLEKFKIYKIKVDLKYDLHVKRPRADKVANTMI